jgi:hypothetical protein
VGDLGLFSSIMNTIYAEKKPEYAFKAIAEHVGCNYIEVLHAFSMTDISISHRCEHEQDSNFKKYEQSVCSDWRIAFGVEKEKRKKSAEKKLTAMKSALQSVRRLISEMKAISDNSSNPKWADFLSSELPTIKQLRNLDAKLQSKINHFKKLPKPRKINPKQKPTAEIVAIRMAILFKELEKPITDSSRQSSKLTGEFPKALKCAFSWFHVDAKPKPYARKIVSGKLSIT